MELYWYDYETWGIDPMRDRPVQFAGVRTDPHLNEISEPLNLLCKPGLDCPISPEASRINHISPQDAEHKGLSEADFAARIHAELTRPQTSAVGYSAMGFDHEVTRLLFYRNLRDPYKWHWQNGNSKWDLITLVRAAHLLRPDVLQVWPLKADGAPSYRLADLVKANVKDPVTPAHEALADVRNMLKVARRIHSGAPRLFDHALSLAVKAEVKKAANDTFLWIDSRLGTERHCAAVFAQLRALERDRIAAFDLSIDPAPFQKPFDTWTDQDRKDAKSAVKVLSANRAPFVMKWSIPPRDPKAFPIMDKLQLDVGLLSGRLTVLRANTSALQDYCEHIQHKWKRSDEAPKDADEAIYSGGFFDDETTEARDRLLRAGTDMEQWDRIQINDRRLATLAFRYRARNYPETLDDAGRAEWKAYCRQRHYDLLDKNRRNAMQRFDEELACVGEKGLSEERIQGLVAWRARVQSELQ